MLPRITAARYVKEFTVWLRFSDGIEGEANLSQELNGPMFKPLRDRSQFAQVHFHPELNTLVWPNGADFAPEFLRSKLQVAA